jgi:hypothetical protein
LLGLGIENENRTIACLKPVIGRFIEGCGTADLISGKQLLEEPATFGRI